MNRIIFFATYYFSKTLKREKIAFFILLKKNPDIDLSAFRLALAWILDFNASATLVPSFIVELFWSAQDQLKDEYWSNELCHTLQSVIAFRL